MHILCDILDIGSKAYSDPSGLGLLYYEIHMHVLTVPFITFIYSVTLHNDFRIITVPDVFNQKQAEFPLLNLKSMFFL